MDFAEQEHVTMLRDTIRRWVAREAPPEKLALWDKQGQIPRHMMDALGELGVCGLTFDEEYGGYGRDLVAATAVIEELARASMALAGLYIGAAWYGGINVAENGSPEQKQAFLPRIARGEMRFAYGLSEPDVGSDLASVRTRGELRDGTIVINGAKRWCSDADQSQYILVLLRSDVNAPRYRNLSFVLVPPDCPGVSISKTETLGLRASSTCDVVFDNVAVPVGNILGGSSMWNRGWEQLAGPALEAEKLEVPALALGVAEAAFQEAWTYAETREQFGQKIAGFQSIRHKLAEAKTKLQAARLMLYWCAWLISSRQSSAAESAMTKYFVTETCNDVVLECQRILGAYGYAEGFAMERYVRDILVTTIFGGSSAIQLNNIANRLGLSRG